MSIMFPSARSDRPEPVHLHHDLLHRVLAEVHAGVQIGEVSSLSRLARWEIGKCERATGYLRKAIRRSRRVG